MAKRVNTRFLIILTAAAAVLILGGVAVHFLFFVKDPATQARQGDALLKEGKPKEALDKYRFAIAHRPGDKELMVKIGDAYNAMVVDDTQSLFQARANWSQVIASDPRYEPALERLLDSYWQQMESSSLDGETYTRVRETAQRLSDVRPGDTGVAAKVHIATVRPWLDGLSVFKANDVDESRKALGQLMQRDPENAEVPYYVALGDLKAAQEKRKSGLPDDDAAAEALVKHAGDVMDAAAAAQPKSAAMQLRAYQVYSVLDQGERVRMNAARMKKARESGVAPPLATAADTKTVNGAKARKALDAALEAARGLDASSPVFADIHIEAAEFARRDRRPEDAEKIYQDLLEKRPDDQNVRIHYAAMLTQAGNAAKREQAIKLLSAEVNLAGLKGVRGFEAAQLRAKTLIDRADARIEQARAEKDDKQRQAIIASAHGDLDKLSSLMNSDSVPVLRIRGRLQQSEGNTIGSIQTFQRAVNLMQGSQNKDFNLINDLANAYIFAGQTGSAKDLLRDVIDRYEWFVPARLQMATVLITENKLDDARLHLAEAEKTLSRLQGQAEVKEYPQWQAYYQRVALALLSKARDPQLDSQFAKMPEGTAAEKLEKARVAQILKKYDEASRLGSAVLAEDPKSLPGLDAVLNAEMGAGRKPAALAVLDKAMATFGGDAETLQKLKLARDKVAAQIDLANATPQQVYESNKKLIEEEPESTNRSLKLADLERKYDHNDRAEAILAPLHQAEPGNVEVMNRLFDLAIARQQWDKAKSFCDKLVATKADGADGLLYQFRLATARGDKTEALRVAKAVRDSRPEFDLGFVAYGQALQAVERYAEAMDSFKQARVRKPLNFDALRGMVQCCYAQNQQKEAKQLLDEARGVFPDDPRFKSLELAHELAFGDPLAVVAAREENLRQDEGNRQAWEDLVEAYRRVARVKYDQDPAKRAEVFGKARDLLTRALAKWKDDKNFTATLASVMAEAGDYAGGEKVLADYAAAPARAADAEPMLLLADYYVRGNQFEKAETVSREGLKRAEAAKDGPTSLRIRMKLAEFLSRFGRHDEALAALDGAKASGPAEEKQIFRQRLQVWISAGRRDLAEQALLEALAKPATANDADLQMTLVAVNFEGGKYDQALERVNTVLKSDPDNVNVRFFRGQILLRKPHPDIKAAIDDLSEVRRRDPSGKGARLLLADAYRMQGDTPHAIKELEDGLRLNPLARELRLRLIEIRSDPNAPDWGEVLRLAREARATEQLKDDPAWAYREAGVYAQRRDWPNAISAIQDAIKLAPRDMNLLREYQNILLLAGQNKEVLAMTDAMARDGKAPWWVYLSRGQARHGLKDEAGAVAEYNTGLTAAGDNSSGVEKIVTTMVNTVGREEALNQVVTRSAKDPRWKLLAAALYSTSKTADGSVEWGKAIAMLDDVQTHFAELTPAQKAQALRIAGPLYQLAKPPQFDKAKKAYEQLLQLEPDDLFALNNLANLLVDGALVPQPQEARQYSQKAYEKVKRAQPFPAAIFDTHGWVLVQCGDVTEGIEVLQKVVRQSTMPESHYHLGEAYLRLKDSRRALEELQAAASAITEVLSQNGQVSADLEKKIKNATEKANEMQRAEKGGQAEAR